MVRLLFNCDDFGKTREVNAAIIKAHTEGVLGSASLMVTGEAFDEAVSLAKAHPKLKVGLHLAMSEAKPALPQDQVSRLIDKTGNLNPDPATNGMRIAFSSQARSQAAKEIEAQFQKFVSTGLTPAHVDGHHHLHMHPFIFEQCIKHGDRLGFQRIRIADEFGSPLPPKRDHNQELIKMFRHFVFKSLANSARRKINHSSLHYFDGVLGLWETGRMSEDYLLKAIPQISSGTWEVYSHVGSHGCEEELPALLSPKLKSLLKERQIEVI
jgi:chitin disaccharide deacetylase